MTVAEIFPWQTAIWQRMSQPDSLHRHHALLLKGRKGIGKLGFALALAKFILCEQGDGTRGACGNCQDCHWFEQGAHPNFCLLVPEALAELTDPVEREGSENGADITRPKSGKTLSQQITVTQIRALDDFIYLSAHQNRYQVVLIHPAEAMNMAAANALLKKLEEPPAEVLFILVAHNTAPIPATILSRCRQIMMPVPDRQLARDWLLQQGVAQPDRRLALSGFAPLQVLQQDEQQVLLHASFIQSLCVPEKFNPIDLAEKLHKQDLSSVTSWLQKWCYDLMSWRVSGRVHYHLQQAEAIKRQAANLDLIAMGFLWRELVVSQQLANHPLNSRLFLEEMFLNLSAILFHNRSETRP